MIYCITKGKKGSSLWIWWGGTLHIKRFIGPLKVLWNWLYRSVRRGVLLILSFLWFTRGVTESWYRRGVITDANLIVLLLIFALLVLAVKSSKERGLS